MTSLCSMQQIRLVANKDKSQVVTGDATPCNRTLLRPSQGIEGALPFRNLGFPITSKKMSKMECRLLLEKITRRVTMWATKLTSYAGRVALINSMFIGIFIFWALIFIIPQEVIKELTAIYKKLLMGGRWGI